MNIIKFVKLILVINLSSTAKYTNKKLTSIDFGFQIYLREYEKLINVVIPNNNTAWSIAPINFVKTEFEWCDLLYLFTKKKLHAMKLILRF